MRVFLIAALFFLLTGCSGSVAWQTVSPLPTPTPRSFLHRSADFDGDGYITVLDWSLWRLHFLAGDIEADLNWDGVVDNLDFHELRRQFSE